ncbi:MAG: DNA replication/repair protein RecF [Salibacteraceae bacterium]
MYLRQISVINFKNHQEANYEFCDTINCFTGNNGVGKTNMLDAIYYLSFSKSFFNAIDSHNINFDHDFFIIQGEYELDNHAEKIYIGLKQGKKKTVKRNQKVYKRLADHIGLFPLVMVSPADANLIIEGSEIRRRFIDGVISQFDKVYLENLLKYNKALTQRNALLKSFAENQFFDQESLSLWNMQMEQFATPIYETRTKFLMDFIPVFQKYYDLVSGNREEVSLAYLSQLNDHSFESLFKENLSAELRSQHTKVGIHKDDLEFLIDGHSVKKYGSQGQQKTYLLALKLAQFDIIKNIKGKKPILLLDDIFDKLDSRRVKALMQLVSDHNFGQIFISDTNTQRVIDLFEDIDIEPKIFEVTK